MGEMMMEPGMEVFETRDYEAEYKKLLVENQELKAHVDWLMTQHDRDCDEKEVARLRGMIEGLKFAIRCNGVSGGEVK